MSRVLVPSGSSVDRLCDSYITRLNRCSLGTLGYLAIARRPMASIVLPCGRRILGNKAIGLPDRLNLIAC